MKGIVLGIFLACITVFAGAQKYTDIKASELPKATQDYIKQNLAGADITRTVKIDDNGSISYGVVYQVRGQKRVLIFDKDGNYVGRGDTLKGGQGQTQATPAQGNSTVQPAGDQGGKSTRPITTDRLPGKAQSYIRTTYPQGKIVSAAQFRDKSVVFYQVHVSDGAKTHVLTFNSKGNYLSKRYYTTPTDQKTTPKPGPQATPPKTNPTPSSENAVQPKK